MSTVNIDKSQSTLIGKSFSEDPFANFLSKVFAFFIYDDMEKKLYKS